MLKISYFKFESRYDGCWINRWPFTLELLKIFIHVFIGFLKTNVRWGTCTFTYYYLNSFLYTFRLYWHLNHRFCVISLPAKCSCILGCNVTHDPIAKSMLKYWLNTWIIIFRYFYQSFDVLLLIWNNKYLQCP